VLKKFGGKGGGTPLFAQGQAAKDSKANDIIMVAMEAGYKNQVNKKA
jgi:hypothetical protein